MDSKWAVKKMHMMRKERRRVSECGERYRSYHISKKLTVLDGDLGASVGSLLGLNEGDLLGL